jgi:hypothetical protein
MSEFLRDSINVSKITGIIGSEDVFQPLVSKVKDIALRIMSFENNNLLFGNVLEKINELSSDKQLLAKSRWEEVDRKYGWNQKIIIDNIEKIVK